MDSWSKESGGSLFWKWLDSSNQPAQRFASLSRLKARPEGLNRAPPVDSKVETDGPWRGLWRADGIYRQTQPAAVDNSIINRTPLHLLRVSAVPITFEHLSLDRLKPVLSGKKFQFSFGILFFPRLTAGHGGSSQPASQSASFAKICWKKGSHAPNKGKLPQKNRARSVTLRTDRVEKVKLTI